MWASGYFYQDWSASSSLISENFGFFFFFLFYLCLFGGFDLGFFRVCLDASISNLELYCNMED